MLGHRLEKGIGGASLGKGYWWGIAWKMELPGHRLEKQIEKVDNNALGEDHASGYGEETIEHLFWRRPERAD